ncbi:hypothetical protein [Verminephrobacter eiseniae]|uniref:hypothetical protein n=1 Tax=Verminephrobacter eiseniae TaxID=364317 RepID=UPI0012EDD7A7|nr:hypothetical protein [Verminephrobacter eiseniae]
MKWSMRCSPHSQHVPTTALARRAMLQSLLNWSHFDPYYFDKLRKLDRGTANKNLEHLRQLQEIRDTRIKADRERRAAQEAARQQPTASLDQLRAEYLDLLADKTSRQQRGSPSWVLGLLRFLE